MNTHTRYIIFAIGLGLFGYLLYGYGIANIEHDLERTGWWFLPIVLVWGVVYFCNALAWYVILGHHRSAVGFGWIFRLSITAFALNYVTPFLSLGGEPYRSAAVNAKLGRHRAVSSVILYNMVRWFAHCLFWLCAIAAALATLRLARAAVLVLASVAAVLVLLMWFFLSRHKYGIFASLLWWMSGIRMLRRLAAAAAPHRSALLVIDEQIRELYARQRAAFYVSVMLEFVSRVIASYEFIFILRALGYAPGFLDACYINAASSLFLNILFFVPFELGAREGGLLLVMQSLAYAPGIGVFVGLVNRLREFVWIVIGMACMLGTERQAERRSLLHIIENERSV